MSRAALPIRIGVLGSAKIARDFITGVASSEIVRVTAVASRTIEKGLSAVSSG